MIKKTLYEYIKRADENDDDPERVIVELNETEKVYTIKVIEAHGLPHLGFTTACENSFGGRPEPGQVLRFKKPTQSIKVYGDWFWMHRLTFHRLKNQGSN